MHHYKELIVRSVLGYGLGWLATQYFYGQKAAKIDPKLASNPTLAEAVEDTDSLQYAEYVKQKHNSKEYDFYRPGKIRD